MSVRLEGIHFLVTYRCTYACDHCFVWGSPDADETMTLAQLTSVIDQAADLGVADVYFEGGEPTLAYPIVLAAAQRAREHGLDVGIVSNCFWATSVDDAKVWLAPFADLGVADLSLSSYAYFVEDANEEQLRNAVLAARELGIPVSVLEVGAPADIGVPGACSGDVGEVMHKGRAAVALAPARPPGRPRRSSPAPSRTSSTPAARTSGPTASCRCARASAPATCSPEATGRRRPKTWPRRAPTACARRSTPTTRTPAPSSARSSPAARGLSPRPPATPRHERSTRTSATSATRCAPRSAPPAATRRSSRRASATPRTSPEEGEDHAV